MLFSPLLSYLIGNVKGSECGHVVSQRITNLCVCVPSFYFWGLNGCRCRQEASTLPETGNLMHDTFKSAESASTNSPSR